MIDTKTLLATLATMLVVSAGVAAAPPSAAAQSDTAPPLDPAHCSDGTYVEEPIFNPNLVGDCVALVAVRNHFMNEPANALLDYGTPWTGTIVHDRVESLDLAGFKLSGTIPAQIADLDKLWSLNLSYNQLTGRIPAELGRLGGLTKLDLGNNQLSGPIPTTLGDME